MMSVPMFWKELVQDRKRRLGNSDPVGSARLSQTPRKIPCMEVAATIRFERKLRDAATTTGGRFDPKAPNGTSMKSGAKPSQTEVKILIEGLGRARHSPDGRYFEEQ